MQQGGLSSFTPSNFQRIFRDFQLFEANMIKDLDRRLTKVRDPQYLFKLLKAMRDLSFGCVSQSHN